MLSLECGRGSSREAGPGRAQVRKVLDCRQHTVHGGGEARGCSCRKRKVQKDRIDEWADQQKGMAPTQQPSISEWTDGHSHSSLVC